MNYEKEFIRWYRGYYKSVKKGNPKEWEEVDLRRLDPAWKAGKAVSVSSTERAVRCRCIEFAEWVNRKDVYQRNNKTWVKNNPLFDKVFAKDTNKLYEIFCEKEGA